MAIFGCVPTHPFLLALYPWVQINSFTFQAVDYVTTENHINIV